MQTTATGDTLRVLNSAGFVRDVERTERKQATVTAVAWGEAYDAHVTADRKVIPVVTDSAGQPMDGAARHEAIRVTLHVQAVTMLFMSSDGHEVGRVVFRSTNGGRSWARHSDHTAEEPPKFCKHGVAFGHCKHKCVKPKPVVKTVTTTVELSDVEQELERCCPLCADSALGGAMVE